jgi:alpha-tubulin suppressor-like RCC1 family protein
MRHAPVSRRGDPACGWAYHGGVKQPILRLAMRAWLAGVAALAPCGAMLGCGRLSFEARDGGGDSGDSGDGGSDAPLALARIAASDTHTCAVVDGVLACCGRNAEGQLGLGDTTDRNVFTPVPGVWMGVAVGRQHTCAITQAGTVACWGVNDQGQLGVGDMAARHVPTPVALAGRAAAIASMYDHTCALLDDGALACWGNNAEGQLGQDDLPGAPDALAPVAVGTNMDWTLVSPGYGHSIGLRGAALYGTGRNTSHQLGMGDGAHAQPRTFTASDQGPWRTVYAGQNMGCGVRANHTLWCWGSNANAELGLGDTNPRSSPALVDDTRTWLDVQVNTFGGCGRYGAGQLACWGRNVEGQLGMGDNGSHPVPEQSGTFDDWIAIAAGRFHTCGMRADRSIWCAGENGNGRIGTGDLFRRNAWTQAAWP